MPNDRPDAALLPASAGQDDIARRVFEGWADMSPEEWAARYAHAVGCSSFDRYRYLDPALHEWIHRLHEILSSPARVEECRKKFLSPREIEAQCRDGF